MDITTKRAEIKQALKYNIIKQKPTQTRGNRSQKDRSVDKEGIAIIGVAGRLPKCNSVAEYWNALDKEQSLIEEIPQSRFDYKKIYDPNAKSSAKSYSKWGGFIPEIYAFDPKFFKVLPNQAAMLDPRQRLLLMSVYHSIEDAGYAPATWQQSNTGVFIGAEENEHLQNLLEWQIPVDEAFAHATSMLANQISYFLISQAPVKLSILCVLVLQLHYIERYNVCVLEKFAKPL